MPNPNHRFDWARMQDKNMQISGIFSKTKLPNLMGRLCAAVLLATTPAHADVMDWMNQDIITLMVNAGSVCSLNGQQIIICKCEQAPGMAQIYQPCPGFNGAFHDEGCRFEDTASDGTFALCADAGKHNFCDICGCKNGVVGAWQTHNSNRARRVIKTPTDDRFACLYTETYEYGCKEGFYTTAPTPSASMTCSRCPSLPAANSKTLYGKSDRGNTSITGCYQPAYTTFEDGVGQYRFRSECNYVEQ